MARYFTSFRLTNLCKTNCAMSEGMRIKHIIMCILWTCQRIKIQTSLQVYDCTYFDHKINVLKDELTYIYTCIYLLSIKINPPFFKGCAKLYNKENSFNNLVSLRVKYLHTLNWQLENLTKNITTNMKISY